MDKDDRMVGRVLSRREVLALLGVAATSLLAACAPTSSGTAQPALVSTQAPENTETPAPSDTAGAATAESSSTAASTSTSAATTAPTLGAPTQAATQAATQASASLPATTEALPTCVVVPAQTEGPYFVDEKLNRSDIRSDPSDGSVKEGLPLQLTLHVSSVSTAGCTPLAGAMVDIWHCDAQGVYSDEQANGTTGQKFLRGYQVTDSKGVVQFQTIYPGWYQGRTVHIHFKVRSGAGSGQTYEFTSQLYFDGAITAKVHAQAPYASRGQSPMKNAQDGIYQSGGSQLMLNLMPAAQGYTGTFDIGFQVG
jgi:protocatechuate 3,4-dioxygenase beta subunit